MRTQAGSGNAFQKHAAYFHDAKVGHIDWRTGSAMAGGEWWVVSGEWWGGLGCWWLVVGCGWWATSTGERASRWQEMDCRSCITFTAIVSPCRPGANSG